MVLLERDMNWREGTRHDRRAAGGEAEAGPRRPLGYRSDNDHAARRDLDDLRAGPDMGAHPRIIGKAILASAGHIFGKPRQWLAMLVGWAQRSVEVDKPKAPCIVAQRCEHQPRAAAPLQTRYHHDFE